MPRLNYYHVLIKDLLDEILDLSHDSLDFYCFYQQQFEDYHHEVDEKCSLVYSNFHELLDDIWDRYAQALREYEVTK